MEFFNDLSKKFSNVAKSVTEKTKDSVEASRIANDLRAAKGELEQLYTELGKVCYAIRTGDGDADRAEEVAGRIEKLLSHIDALSAQRDAIKDVKRCPGCGAVVSKEARFCSSCGKRLPEEAPEPAAEDLAEAQYCPDCGAQRAADERFCSVCGKSFDGPRAEVVTAEPAETAAEPVNVEEPDSFGDETVE